MAVPTTSVLYIRCPEPLRERLGAIVEASDRWPRLTMNELIVTMLAAAVDQVEATAKRKPAKRTARKGGRK